MEILKITHLIVFLWELDEKSIDSFRNSSLHIHVNYY